jgi:hypothetical protein
MNRLLTAVSAPQADEVGKMKMELRRLIFDEQVRGEKRKVGGSLIEPAAAGNLKPWREVVTPHADVASGRYQQAEFAADLHQVWSGNRGISRSSNSSAALSYRKPQAPRSAGCNACLARVATRSFSPNQLRRRQDHSMLALYHLFGGGAPASWPASMKYSPRPV